VIFVALSLRELAPRLYYQFASLGEEEKNSEFCRIIQHLRDWTEAARQTTDALLLISNFSSPPYNQLGIADLKLANGETEFYLRLNLALMELFRADSRANLFDLDRVLSRFGKIRACNPQMHYLARMEWHERLLPYIADELFRYINALLGRSKKCLVVDLDNTLWGGVLGEEGPEGVAIGHSGPQAEAYQAFQHAILALKQSGIILAINSKNNRDEVVELFETREMPLKLDDFSAIEINWNHKHENLKRIAESLNIGADSLVFVDDNPAECALVRELLPQVKVIELPRDPAHFPDLMKSLPDFEKLEISREDRDKAKQYLENRQRSEYQESIGSLEGYLRELKTEITIRAPAQSDAARIHQLFSKTNQFNLTTKRYAPGDIEKFLSDSKHVMRVVDVKDRFGELGTVGLVLMDVADTVAHIDSFMLSCRAMGRQIETAIMNSLKQDYLQMGRYHAFLCNYVPTKKNKPVEEFYESQGFTLLEKRPSGEKLYRLSAADSRLDECSHITVTAEGQDNE